MLVFVIVCKVIMLLVTILKDYYDYTPGCFVDAIDSAIENRYGAIVQNAPYYPSVIRGNVNLKKFKVCKVEDQPVSIVSEVSCRKGPLYTMKSFRSNTYEYGIFEGHDKLCCELVNDFDKLHLYGEFPGITSPYIYSSVQNSIFSIHQEDCLSVSINICYSGVKTWHLINRDDVSKLLTAIRKMRDTNLHSDYLKCNAILQHKNLFFDTSFFENNSIRYIEIDQKPGDVIITTVGSIHQGINTTANFNAAVNIFTDAHFKKNMKKVLKYCTHKSGCGMSNASSQRLFSIFEMHDTGRHVFTAEERQRGNSTQKRKRDTLASKLAFARQAKKINFDR